MKQRFLWMLLAGLSVPCLQAQVCDPSVAPTGLTSTYTPGTGALLEWDAVPGSQGIQVKVDILSGSSHIKRIGGFELDQFFVPDVLLGPGVYTWRVQATCSAVPPFDPTPISASTVFTIGGSSSCPASVTDVDGNVYNTILIIGQCWMQENLKVEHYNNGDAITTGLNDSAWLLTYLDSTGAFAAYNDVASNKDRYGLLYNHYAVSDARGLCPTGWSAGTDGEWSDLREYFGGLHEAGGRLKATGTLSAGTGYWQDPNNGATNSSGFTAQPGGNRASLGNFSLKGYSAFFWSTNKTGRYRQLFHDGPDMYREFTSRMAGMSVRCLKD